LSFGTCPWATGPRPVLRNVSFTAANGALTVLVGPNGCGKTTLLRSAARQLPLLAGTVQVDGRDAAGFERKEFARAVSFMPQMRGVPDIDVDALVCHGRFPHLGLSRHLTAADRDAVERAMERMDVSGWRERSMRELSGGERQRVYLAMALCQESGNLLLDEPSAWLDAPRQFELLELLKSLAAEGKTVVMVLHELAQAMQYADRIALLSGGALRAALPPEELFSSGLAEEVFGVGLRRAPDGTYYVRAR
jgi:ABC-type cobalamin/Fe3+-siderophores transport system ATPase subunit